MRFVVRATISVEDGNKMVKDPNFMRTLEEDIKTDISK